MILNKKLIIAVDGYSSCGKSTFAKAIASELNYIYIDTGAMYRAVTLYALRNNLISGNFFNKEKLVQSLPELKVSFKHNSTEAKNEVELNGEVVENDIRGMQVSQFVSQVSAVKEVRVKMADLQREMGKIGGVVLDGRDIGTVIFPNADIKIFMTADPKVRAQRRYDELTAKGYKVSFDEIYDNVVQRDKQDTSREESPLTQAPDAIVLDNSYMLPEQQMIWFLDLVKKFQ
jgi:cytidylate kinase